MEKVIQRVLLVTLLLICCQITSAENDVEINGLNYILNNDGTASVGKNRNAVGDIVIPEFVEYDGNKYFVTALSDESFKFCHDLRSVVLSNGITSLGDKSFASCI